MSTKTQRFYTEDLEKLKVLSAGSGKDEKDILRELLASAAPEEVIEEVKRLSRARVPERRKKTEAITGIPQTGVTDIGSRIKSIIADAVETKVYLTTLGIDLGGSKQPQQQYPPWMYPPQMMQQQPQQPKKDIMVTVAEIKALESLEKGQSDPAILEILKELKDQAKQNLEQQQKPKSSMDEMKEMVQMAGFYRMVGQPEAANKLEQMLQDKLEKMDSRLHETEKSMLQQASDFRIQDLQRQIQEIRNAPSQFDQIVSISKMAETDPAIKKYVHAKLGIQDKGEPLTPEKLGKYIENVQVPVGKIVKGIYDMIQQARGAQTTTGPPPPTTQPPPSMQREAEMAEKVLGTTQPGTGVLPPFIGDQPQPTEAQPRTLTPTETLGTTIDEANLPPGVLPQTEMTTPEQAKLPPDESSPTAEKGPPPPPKKEGGKKKSTKK